ncbi:MAG: ACT domain-containing protein [Gammaproteobacteria bacterium]|nr:ACT domain-containing protein [Gammaproteobacteria bacterium]
MSCSHASGCALYPQISLSSALKVWQVFYCEGDFSKCARFQASSRGEAVPANLLPNGKKLEFQSSSDKDSDAQTLAMASAAKEDLSSSSSGSALAQLQEAMDAMSSKSPSGRSESRPVPAAPVATKSQELDLDLDMDHLNDKVSGSVLGSPASAGSGSSSTVVNPAVTKGETSSYYLRLRARDESGVMAKVIQALGKHRISVDAMAQKKVSPSQPDTVLIIVTGQVKPDVFAAAMADLAVLDVINGKVVSLPLEYLGAELFG